MAKKKIVEPVVKGSKKKTKEKIIKDTISKKPNIFKRIKNYIMRGGIKKMIWFIVLSLLIFGSSCLLIFALYIIISSPDFDKDKLYSKEATVIYYKDGTEMARVGDQNRELITYEELPQVFIDALIATEDSRYFQHNGLDIARFLKASFKQLSGSDEGGASTITMQLIKNTYTKGQESESRFQSFIRKFRDIYMAVFKLESSYTKEEIMEFYVNSLWLGNDGNLNYTGISGVQQASKYYFGKNVSELTLAESSLLVGMYQNAAFYNPYRNPEGCRNRQRTVLKLMVLHEYITEDEMNDTLNIPIQSLLVDYSKVTKSLDNQATIDYILDEVEEKTGLNPYQTPMQIYTTVDRKIQNVLTEMENGEIFKYYDDNDQEGTCITSVEDGSVVALSGGRNYKAKGLNRAVDISRQPGSTAKPIFDYGPYIELLNGSTGDYFFDEPYTYSNGTKITDADNSYQGIITMRTALMNSRNIPALQAFQKVMAADPEYIPNFVHKFRIDYGENLYESASIGGFEGVSPLEMSAAYAVFGRGGYYIEPYIFTKIIYEDGTTFEYKYEKEKIISEETAYMITSMLINVIRDFEGNINITGSEIAGKTGTTTVDKKSLEAKGLPDSTIMDSWTISYSTEYSIALWYGYDELTKETYMDTTQGWKARSKLMGGIAKKIYNTNKTFKKPSGVVSVTVEKYTFPLQLPSAYTPDSMKITELFKEGTEPTEVSPKYSKLASPTNGNYSKNGNIVTINWNSIKNPESFGSNAMQKLFNENYGSFASNYYEKIIGRNNEEFGHLVYDIFLEDSSGNTTFVDSTTNTSFVKELSPGNYKFIVKSAYFLFKGNTSDGLTINVTVDNPHKEETEEKEKIVEEPKPNNKNNELE